MIAYQIPKPRAWTPTPISSMVPRKEAASLGQRQAAKPLDLNNDSVYNFAVVQGVTLAYAATASFLYGKSYPIVDRILLGVGAVAFGAASVFSYVLLDAKGPGTWNPVDGVVGGVMGTVNGLIALGAAGAVFKSKLPSSSAQKAVAASLPI